MYISSVQHPLFLLNFWSLNVKCPLMRKFLMLSRPEDIRAYILSLYIGNTHILTRVETDCRIFNMELFIIYILVL